MHFYSSYFCILIATLAPQSANGFYIFIKKCKLSNVFLKKYIQKYPTEKLASFYSTMSKQKCFFENINSLTQLKREYIKLVKIYHPDKNPNNAHALEMIKKINNEFKKARKELEPYKIEYGNSLDTEIEKMFQELKNSMHNIKHGIGHIEKKLDSLVMSLNELKKTLDDLHKSLDRLCEDLKKSNKLKS